MTSAAITKMFVYSKGTAVARDSLPQTKLSKRTNTHTHTHTPTETQ